MHDIEVTGRVNVCMYVGGGGGKIAKGDKKDAMNSSRSLFVCGCAWI